MKLEKNKLPRFNQVMNRDVISRQVLKICYACRKGFCKTKGREKHSPVADQIGRYICKKCVNEILNGQTNARVSVEHGGIKTL